MTSIVWGKDRCHCGDCGALRAGLNELSYMHFASSQPVHVEESAKHAGAMILMLLERLHDGHQTRFEGDTGESMGASFTLAEVKGRQRELNMSVPLDPRGPGECLCSVCEALKAACRKAVHIFELGRQPEHVRCVAHEALHAVGHLLDALHQVHRVDWYEAPVAAEEEATADEGATWDVPKATIWDVAEEPALESLEPDYLAFAVAELNLNKADEPSPVPQYSNDWHRKFMVCDHCYSHGLPCNEAPICDQCQMSEMPCVHRVCRLSPRCKAGCTSPTCRYVHTDHLPVPSSYFAVGDYILMPGKLRVHLAEGRLPRWLAHHDGWSSYELGEEFSEAIKERQRAGRKALHDTVKGGGCTLQNVHIKCHAPCQEARSALKEPEPCDDEGVMGWVMKNLEGSELADRPVMSWERREWFEKEALIRNDFAREQHAEAMEQGEGCEWVEEPAS